MIKEKFELIDESSKKEISSFYSEEVIHLLRMGGSIKFTFRDSRDRDYELHDAISGKSYNLSNIDELYFGEFNQWEEFKFFLKNKETGEKTYAKTNDAYGEEKKCNHEIFGSSINRINGAENEIIERLSFESGQTLSYTLTIDSSKARIPTAKALDCVGDMFSPSESFSFKEKEWGYISIKSQKNSISYSFFVETPYQQVLGQNIIADYEGNYRIGPVQVGDEIVIGLESDYPVLSGRKIYGRIKESDSTVVEFDTWTDLDFDDLDIELHEGIMPKDIQEIKVNPFPFVNRFGDDVLIELTGATKVGRDKEFDKDQLFDVWLEEEFHEYGNLSSLDGTKVGTRLTNVTQPILFIGTDIKDLEDIPDFILNLDINAKAILDFPYERTVEGKDDIRLRDELLKIRFDPEVIEPGDTAKVIPYFEYSDDTIQEFEPDHEFDIAGIVQGTGDNGVLRDINGREDDFISGIKPGFTFIADSTLKEDAHVWIGVATEIELKEKSAYKSVLQSSAEIPDSYKAALVESVDYFIEETTKNSKVGENIRVKLNEIRERVIETQTNSAKRKASSNTRSSYEIGYGRLDITQKKCGESETICSLNDQKQQTLSNNSIEVYSEGDNFRGNDYSTGNSFNTNVQGCTFKSPNNATTTRLGVNFIMGTVPLKRSSNTPIYIPLTDYKLDVCVVESSNKWNFNVSGLRIPIFNSYCTQHTYTDLEDGNNFTLLSKYIKNKSDYKVVIQDLNYWIKGPYIQKGKLPNKFVFSSGILKHEEKHLLDTKTRLKKDFDNAFRDIRKFNETQNDIECPECVKSQFRTPIELTLKNALITSANQGLTQAQKSNNEKKADLYASNEYKKIKVLIETWAKSQKWFTK